MARAYRLIVGTTPGAGDALDTGEIQVNQRFVESLPTGVPLYASLTTYFVASQAKARHFVFTKATNGIPDALKLEIVRASVAQVRNSSLNDAPNPYSILEKTMLARNANLANCSDYANALVAHLKQIGVGNPARIRGACLTPNGFECHTFTEVFDAGTARWLLFDPTFGFAVRRASDNAYATAEEISTASRSERWSDINYEPLTTAGLSYAKSYYVDYPLLFIHLFDATTGNMIGEEQSVIHLYNELTIPHTQDHAAAFAFRCPDGVGTTSVRVGEAQLEIPCTGIDNLTQMVWGSTIDVPPDDIGNAPQF